MDKLKIWLDKSAFICHTQGNQGSHGGRRLIPSGCLSTAEDKYERKEADTMKKYQPVEIEVIEFRPEEDVVVTSEICPYKGEEV